jgi:putative SOS response-associated peptidase YedK
MPAVLREEDHETWLAGTPAEAKGVLTPYPSDLMVAWQVSRKVNNVKGPNDSGLIEPIAGRPAPALDPR